MIFTSILILIVAKALPFINLHITSIYFSRISAIILVYAGVLSLNTLFIQSIGSGIGIYSGLFHITQVSVSLESFLLIIGSLILIAWPSIRVAEGSAKANPDYNYYCAAAARNRAAAQAEYYNIISKSEDYSLIVLFSTLGSCLLISCFDLLSLYISIELQSFGLYVLATLYKDSYTSTKAGLKYFLLGGLSSCIILLGCGLIYSYTGLTNFESIYSIISTANFLSLNFTLSAAAIAAPVIEFENSASAAIQGLSLGLILIFIGFLFKIAAAPLHNWSPDVYDEVPTIVTIWLTIIPKIAILILLLELQYYGFNFAAAANAAAVLKTLLLVSSFLSLLVGTIVGLAQTRIKRLLAYSTISHIGFMLLALAINSESSIDSLIFYIIQYSLTNLNIFLVIIGLSYIMVRYSDSASGAVSLSRSCAAAHKCAAANSAAANAAATRAPAKAAVDITYITEFKEQFLANPILSLSLAICLFSMAGIPPLIGFFSKQFVLYSAIQNGYYFISIIAILVSVISASYYLKIVKVLYTAATNAAAAPAAADAKAPYYLSNIHSFVIAILTLLILLFTIKPNLILNSTQLLSLSLFYW